MAGIFQRLFKTGEAEAHALVDKLEDPIKMSEQAIRDLKKDLTESLKSLAEVKALAIRMDRAADEHVSVQIQRRTSHILRFVGDSFRVRIVAVWCRMRIEDQISRTAELTGY